MEGLHFGTHTTESPEEFFLSLEPFFFLFFFYFKAPGPKLIFTRYQDFYLVVDSTYSSSFLKFLLKEEQQYYSILNEFTKILKLYF